MIELGSLKTGELSLRCNAMQTQGLSANPGYLANLTNGIAQDFVACSSNHRGVKTCIHGRPALRIQNEVVLCRLTQ
jgi:hypothetical protein